MKQVRPIKKSCSPIEISSSHQGASIGALHVSAQAVAEQHKAAKLDQSRRQAVWAWRSAVGCSVQREAGIAGVWGLE